MEMICAHRLPLIDINHCVFLQWIICAFLQNEIQHLLSFPVDVAVLDRSENMERTVGQTSIFISHCLFWKMQKKRRDALPLKQEWHIRHFLMKTKQEHCFPSDVIQKSSLKYVRPWIHRNNGSITFMLHIYSIIIEEVQLQESLKETYFKVTFNQSTSTACWSHNILQSQYVLHTTELCTELGRKTTKKKKTQASLHICGSFFTQELLQKHLKRKRWALWQYFIVTNGIIKPGLGKWLAAVLMPKIIRYYKCGCIHQVIGAAWYQHRGFPFLIMNSMTIACI